MFANLLSFVFSESIRVSIYGDPAGNMTVNQLPDKTARMEPTSPRDSTMSLKTSAAYSRIDFSLRHERGVQRKWTSQLRKSHYENVFIFISFFTSMRVISILTKIYFSLSSPSLSSESEVHRITFKAHSIKAVFGTSKFKSSQFSQHSLSPFHEKNTMNKMCPLTSRNLLYLGLH